MTTMRPLRGRGPRYIHRQRSATTTAVSAVSFGHGQDPNLKTFLEKNEEFQTSGPSASYTVSKIFSHRPSAFSCGTFDFLVLNGVERSPVWLPPSRIVWSDVVHQYLISHFSVDAIDTPLILSTFVNYDPCSLDREVLVPAKSILSHAHASNVAGVSDRLTATKVHEHRRCAIRPDSWEFLVSLKKRDEPLWIHQDNIILGKKMMKYITRHSLTVSTFNERFYDALHDSSLHDVHHPCVLHDSINHLSSLTTLLLVSITVIISPSRLI